jgi:hypothetical protein
MIAILLEALTKDQTNELIQSWTFSLQNCEQNKLLFKISNQLQVFCYSNDKQANIIISERYILKVFISKIRIFQVQNNIGGTSSSSQMEKEGSHLPSAWNNPLPNTKYMNQWSLRQ